MAVNDPQFTGGSVELLQSTGTTVTVYYVVGSTYLAHEYAVGGATSFEGVVSSGSQATTGATDQLAAGWAQSVTAGDQDSTGAQGILNAGLVQAVTAGNQATTGATPTLTAGELFEGVVTAGSCSTAGVAVTFVDPPWFSDSTPYLVVDTATDSISEKSTICHDYVEDEYLTMSDDPAGNMRRLDTDFSTLATITTTDPPFTDNESLTYVSGDTFAALIEGVSGSRSPVICVFTLNGARTSIDSYDTYTLNQVTEFASGYGAEGLAYDPTNDVYYVATQPTGSGEGGLWLVDLNDIDGGYPAQTLLFRWYDTLISPSHIGSGAVMGDIWIPRGSGWTSERVHNSIFVCFRDDDSSPTAAQRYVVQMDRISGAYISKFHHNIPGRTEGMTFRADASQDLIFAGEQSGPNLWRYSTNVDQSTIVDYGSAWRYDDQNVDRFNDDTEPFYDPDYDNFGGWTASTPTGAGIYYFGTIDDVDSEASLGTTVSKPTDSNAIYFVKDVSLSGVSVVSAIVLDWIHEDSGVFYINGTEVERGLIDDLDTVTHTYKSGDTKSPEGASIQYTLTDSAILALLVDGTNRFACVIVQTNSSSTDGAFDIRIKFNKEHVGFEGTVTAGSCNTTGTTSTLAAGWEQSVTAGSQASTSYSGSLAAGWEQAVTAGSQQTTGSLPTLDTGVTPSPFEGSVTSGSQATTGAVPVGTFGTTFEGIITAGSQATTGSDASLTSGLVLVIISGSQATSGAVPVGTFGASFQEAVTAGSQQSTGATSSLAAGIVLVVTSGSQATTGSDASLAAGAVLFVTSGSQATTGALPTGEFGTGFSEAVLSGSQMTIGVQPSSVRGLAQTVVSGSVSTVGAVSLLSSGAVLIVTTTGTQATTGSDGSVHCGWELPATAGACATGASAGSYILGIAPNVTAGACNTTGILPLPIYGSALVILTAGTCATSGVTIILTIGDEWHEQTTDIWNIPATVDEWNIQDTIDTWNIPAGQT